MRSLLKLSSNFYKLASALPNPTIAYHIGALDLKGGMFSLDHLKTGEGMAYLGPGTYFVTSETIAKKYIKYRPNDATLYQCSIDTSKIYDPFKGIPENYRGTLDRIGRDILDIAGLKKLPYVSSLDYGINEIGVAHKLFGAAKTAELFKKHNLSGFYEEIQPGIYEICVFDYSCIQILSKKIMVDQDRINIAKEKERVQQKLKKLAPGDTLLCQFLDASKDFTIRISQILEDNYITFDVADGPISEILEPYYSFANENYGLWTDEKSFVDDIYDAGGKVIFQ